MSNTNTALQITDFNFYGDSLIALRDNATGKIYTSISQVLKAIGFTEKQTEYQRKKFLKDSVIASDTQKFLGVDLGMPSVGEIWCISNRKLPIALTKITVTPKMKKTQPELAAKLELYQDKCADVLASVFIDNQTANSSYTQLIDVVTTLTNIVTAMQTDISTLKESQAQIHKQIPCKKKYSYWTSKMFPKYKALVDYFGISNTQLYHQLYIEFQNINPDIDLNQLQDDYCYKNKLSCCFTLDAIEHDKTVRPLFESMVDNLLRKYGLACDSDDVVRIKTIFNE